MNACASNKIIMTLFVIMLFFNVYLFPHHQSKINTITSKTLTSLDARLSYSFNDVVSLLDNMGSSGRDIYYFVSSRIDLIYPIVYGVFFTLVLINLLNRFDNIKRQWQWLALIPILAVFFDYLENINIQRLLINYPNITESQVAFANMMTQLKWVSLIAVLIIIIAIWLITLKQKLTQK